MTHQPVSPLSVVFSEADYALLHTKNIHTKAAPKPQPVLQHSPPLEGLGEAPTIRHVPKGMSNYR
ncbi:MAG: hypothetical protein EAZ47_02555 [Bacteroidetes bacterium]|nr:MAG: hypothetical protein EAZ47_02555 [Bacteroidota bacterium]